jgi:3-oxoadipate enol-lactonase
MNFAAVNNITLHYALEGTNTGIPLVFVNPLGSDLRIWDRLVPFFADRFPLLRFDKRGHGLSDCPPAPYSIRDFSNDLAGLLEHLTVNEAILVGSSIGGMISMDYATAFPQQVKALILCDTGAKLATAEYWTERIEAIGEKGMKHAAGGVMPRWFAPSYSARHPADYQGYTNMLLRMPVEGYIASCEALRDADLRESMDRIKVRSLVLCGAEDLATPPDFVREFAGTLPDAGFELIEGAGHTPSVERPETMAMKIDQFLKANGYG